jgi:hypothetical protein
MLTATKVGIREFRAGLADHIDADAPVAVTPHKVLHPDQE